MKMMTIVSLLIVLLTPGVGAFGEFFDPTAVTSSLRRRQGPRNVVTNRNNNNKRRRRQAMNQESRRALDHDESHRKLALFDDLRLGGGTTDPGIGDGGLDFGGGGGSDSGGGGSWVLIHTTYDKHGNPLYSQMANPAEHPNVRPGHPYYVQDKHNKLVHKFYYVHRPGDDDDDDDNSPSTPAPFPAPSPTPAPLPAPIPAPVAPPINTGGTLQPTPAPVPAPFTDLPTTPSTAIPTEVPTVFVPTAPEAPLAPINANNRQQMAPTRPPGTLTPPKKVITFTDSPTSAQPTTAFPTVTPISRKVVATTKTQYETVGSINLIDVERSFFDTTQFMLESFLELHVGSILRAFKLTLTFQETAKVSEQTDGETTLYTNIFDVRIRFDLEGSKEEVNAFHKQDANEIQNAFFQGGDLVALLAELNKRNIDIKMIRLYDPDAAPAVPDTPPPEETSDDGGRSMPVIVFAAVLCGFIILGVVAVVVFMKRRQARQMYYYGQEENIKPQPLGSPMSSVYSTSTDSDNSGSGGIRQSALQKNRQSRQDQAHPDNSFMQTMDLVSLTDSDEAYSSGKSDKLSAPRPYSSDGDPASSEEFDSQMDRESYQDSRESGNVEDVFRVQNPFDYNEVAAATLTNLDGDGSLKGIDQSYPEFEMFVNVTTPPTPEWANNENPFDAQNHEYQNHRKRWQEDANDMDSIGLPDRDDASSHGSYYDDQPMGGRPEQQHQQGESHNPFD